MQYFNEKGEPVTLLQLIRSEPEWAESRINALSAALSDLLDEQNEPPLIEREVEWQAAVDAARIQLGYSEA